MENIINSIHNPQIKYVISLQRRRNREATGCYFIEGIRLVEEAFTAGAKIETILYSPKLLQKPRGRQLYDALAAQQYKLLSVTDELMEKVADTENPQGILAVVRIPQLSPGIITAGTAGLFVLVDRVQDPGNLGTIIRTADGTGASAVFLLPGTVDLYNPKTIRATMGSLFHLPVLNIADPLALFANLKQQNVKIYVAGLGGAQFYYQADYKGPTAFVVGNEANGVDEELLANGDAVIKIPLYGQAESLNVAIATGILLYEAIRQRSVQA